MVRARRRLDAGQLRECAHPRHGFVANVEDHRQASAGAQDASDLGEGLRAVEPVEGLRTRHRVERRVGERDGLRGSIPNVELGERRLQDPAHARHRLDGDERRAERNQQPRELAGSGGEVEHARADADRELGSDEFDRLRRVRRPGSLVRIRRAIESDGGCRVDG